MKRTWFRTAPALVLALVFVPCLAAEPAEPMPQEEAPAAGTRFGLQAATSFQDLQVGLKIQMEDFAITPRFGFFYQSVRRASDAFNFTFGSGFDYYLKSGKLRPYVGADLLFCVTDTADTDIWVILYPHVGAEYWLGKDFSLGGNLGPAFGFGKSRFTPNTIGMLVVESEFTFGINAVLNITYYF